MLNNFDTISFDASTYALIIIAVLLFITAIRVILSKTLVDSIIIVSVFSLLISISYLLMDAPDVAMTETALGACLSTCVLLNFIALFPQTQKLNISLKYKKVIPASMLCALFMVIMTYAGSELPNYGTQDSKLQAHVSKYYIENTKNDIGIPSMVAALLGSYRGYDTLGETSVILIAGLAVVLVLAKNRKSQ